MSTNVLIVAAINLVVWMVILWVVDRQKERDRKAREEKKIWLLEPEE